MSLLRSGFVVVVVIVVVGNELLSLRAGQTCHAGSLGKGDAEVH